MQIKVRYCTRDGAGETEVVIPADPKIARELSGESSYSNLSDDVYRYITQAIESMLHFQKGVYADGITYWEVA